MNITFFKKKKILVTGHTGFKGSWLCEILLLAGAEVHGYALVPETVPALFNQLGLADRLASHTIGDIRDFATFAARIECVRPDIIFHLAAQPLVRRSYQEPAQTFDTNVMGTVNLLEAARRIDWAHPCSIVCITTDKCYENDNSGHAFREGDPLGGADPYSASKGACEIAISSYRRSFFSAPDSMVQVASARAGNVIGGGDWAEDRIVPDAMRAFLNDKVLTVRNRRATRPWQHVLEPLTGYLMLGRALAEGLSSHADVAAPSALAFNFGPNAACVKTVGDLVSELRTVFPSARIEDHTDPTAPREAQLLQLDSTKAHDLLGWAPRWDFVRTISETSAWYKAVAEGADPVETTRSQIRSFLEGT